MSGIFKLAYKLLVNDKAKFTALLVGNTFAVFGMTFAMSMFSGVLYHSFSTVTNIGASIWVMDPAVQTVANSIGMPDYVLDVVRSIQGVKYAVPLYSGMALVKLSDGNYQSVSVLGLDDTSLFGRPELTEGGIQDTSPVRDTPHPTCSSNPRAQVMSKRLSSRSRLWAIWR